MNIPLEDIVSWHVSLMDILDPTRPMSFIGDEEQPPLWAREQYLANMVHETATAQELPEDQVRDIFRGCRELLPDAELFVWDSTIYINSTENYHQRIGQPVRTRLPRAQLWLVAPQLDCPDGHPQLDIRGECRWCGAILLPAIIGKQQNKCCVSVEVFTRLPLSDETLFRVWIQDYDRNVGQIYAEVETALDYLDEEADWEPALVPPVSQSSKPSAPRLPHEPRYCVQIRRRLPEGARRQRSTQQEVQTKEFRCHFEVREHIRRLAQPRRKDGAETTTVRAHVRGDMNMPFHPKPQAVIKVTR